MGSNFDLTPSRDDKVEFPPTAEGRIRRVVFYAGAAIAAICGLVILSSIAVAFVSIGKQLLHLH
jgi:hypothetical protein